ncbi:MAG: YqeG family HAD IIIA-type phosphatase [Clostridia bacterium]|nr:YqeG family HAD IIIA-type phosphatase [Clostridia bacterium]
MILYPKIYLNNVQQITYELLIKNNIQGLILDVDNTLIDYDKNMPEGIKTWCEDLKQEGIQFCIVSNSNKKEKVEMVANILKIPYIYFAKKPLKAGLVRAKKKINLPFEKIAVVGDQIFTDVLGANRCHMTSILVEPIKEKDIFITVIKRPIENYIKRKYKQKMKGEKTNVYT